MTEQAKNVLAEVIDFFADDADGPGDWWAPADDKSSFSLDWRNDEGRKFWIDLNKDGTISVLWKRPDGETSVVIFSELTSR